MKKISLDSWVQLIGLLSILAGLVALVIELNQSQRLSQATVYQRWEALGLTERIQPPEWKEEIENRLRQN